MRLNLMRGSPLGTSIVVFIGLVVSGLVGLLLAWKGAAGVNVVAEQVPYLVSGGFGGVGLIGFGIGVLRIQVRRWTESRRRAEFDAVVKSVEELLLSVRVGEKARGHEG